MLIILVPFFLKFRHISFCSFHFSSLLPSPIDHSLRSMGSRHFSFAFPSIPPLLLLLIVLLGNEEWCEAEEQQLDYFHCASSDAPGHEQCPSGLCFDLFDIRTDQISSGCATPASSLCFSAGCSLLSDQQSFVCCCAHPFCNGKSPALIRARWRMFRKGDYPGVDGGRLKKKSARELPDEGRDKPRAGKDEEVKRRKMNDKEDEEEPKKGMKAGVVKGNNGTSEEMKKAQQGKEEMEQQKRKNGEMAKTTKAPEKKSAGGNEGKAGTRSTAQNGTDGMKVEEKKEKTEEGQGRGGDERIKKADEGGQEKKREKMEEKKAEMITKKDKEEGKGGEEGKKVDERTLEGGTKVESKGRTTEEKVGKEEAKGRKVEEAKAKVENKGRTTSTTERSQMTTKKGSSNGTEATTPTITTTTLNVKKKEEGTTTAVRAKTTEKKAQNGTHQTTSRINAPLEATNGTTTTTTSWTSAPGKGATAASRARQISATTTISVPISPPRRQAIVAPPRRENKPNVTDNNWQQATNRERNNKTDEGQNLVKNREHQPARFPPSTTSSTTSGTTRSERTTRSPTPTTDHQQKKKEAELVPAFPWYWVALAGFACSAAVFALVYWTVRGCRRVFQKGRRAARGRGEGEGEEEKPEMMAQMNGGGGKEEMMGKRKKRRVPVGKKDRKEAEERNGGLGASGKRTTNESLMSQCTESTMLKGEGPEGQNGTGTEEGAEYGGGERVTVLDPLLNQQWSGTMSK